MTSPERHGDDSLLELLQASGLSVVSRLGASMRVVALGLAAASSAYALIAFALWPESLSSAHAPFGGALPAAVAAPFYAMAWRAARRERLQACGHYLFVALLSFSLLASWPRGAFYPGWYAQPILALLASCCLGIVPGLTMALVGVAAMAIAPLAVEQALLPGIEADRGRHSTSLMALTLGSALTGVIVHKVLVASLQLGEARRQKQLEHERALRYREKLLRHALRVETVGDLAGLVSHQLRNAFQVMLGHVALQAMDGEEKSGERLRLVGETLEQARPLLDQLMALAHPDDGVVQLGDLNEWVARFFDRARRVVPSSITVRFEPTPESLPVQLDPRGLEHALWNLVINARHAMPEGGVIRLATERIGETAVLAVADSGCGMSEEVKQRIFDPYFTTKPVGQGTGLGLTAVERFVRASQGTVVVDSEQGKGATFRLSFPLARAAVAEATSA